MPSTGSDTLQLRLDDRIFEVHRDQTVLEVLRSSGIAITAPCGGKGRCGKCRIRLIEGALYPPGPEEAAVLGDADLHNGFRLACRSKLRGPVTVALDRRNQLEVLRDIEDLPALSSPVVVKHRVAVGDPDWRRGLADLGDLAVPDDINTRLSRSEDGGERTVTIRRRSIVALEPGDSTGSCYGFAVDLGTTSIVVYLLDLAGRVVDSVSQPNRQAVYGIDVISRIAHAAEKDGLNNLCAAVRGQLADMMGLLVSENGVNPSHVYECVISGNTTMLHILSNISPSGIAHYPYTPTFLDRVELAGSDDPFSPSFPHSETVLLPGISAYIGADIVAGILSTEMWKSEELCLLVDVGTNGEMVLGNKYGMLCCSTAAGSAFEGYHLSSGAQAVAGAISAVQIRNGDIEFRTIADKPPIGICGSGVVDALAVLVETGLVDSTGRFAATDSLPEDLPVELLERRRGEKRDAEFVVAPENQGAAGKAVCLSQKDVREIQMAKAAIAYGIEILLEKRRVRSREIGRVYLAGGFGSYIDESSARVIGMLPEAFEGKIVGVRNSSLRGAAIAAMSSEATEDMENIRHLAKYIELSREPSFAKGYMKHMGFPCVASVVKTADAG